MKRTISLLSLMLILLPMAFFAQQNNEWEKPEIFAVNKEPYRTTSYPYPNQALALEDVREKSPYFQSLDGDWKFKWVPKPADAPQDFYKENYDVSSWKTIPVPGNWELQGYGEPVYTTLIYPFPVNPPFVDREDNPVGTYRHDFTVADDWSGRRIFLHFEGGTTAMYVWVNGEYVGYTENAKSPAEFDITKYARKGKNTLACKVFKYGDGSYLEDQDMWRLGGISRSVYLYSTADTRILDYFAHPELDKNYKNGLFNTDVILKNYNEKPQNMSLELSLFDKAGKTVLSRKQTINLPANSTQSSNFSGTISSVLKWTAETPNLYNMLITLKDSKGDIVESTSHKIGFRKIEITDGQLFVNGVKVLFKGVNLHEFNYKKGQVVDREIMIRNIQLMKELNINSVRTAHYPQIPLWYKLCDEYGLYLVDEANLESHGLGYGPENVSNFPEWDGAHLDRVKALVERDKNHTSVVVWSLGNEASNGKAFFDLYDWVKARDNSRPAQYEQASNKQDPTKSPRNTDIICPMYPEWDMMNKVSKIKLDRPYIMCEYAHAMGNSMGNFQEYWDLIRKSYNMQGGFIWEWYNHGFEAKDEQGRPYWAYGGDLNSYSRRNDNNFCMDGLISPDQEYMPHVYIVKKVYQNILFEVEDLDKGLIKVINDFKFTDINNKNYSFKWVLLKNGEKTAEGDFSVNVKADTPASVKLNLPNIEQKEGVEYYLQVFAYTKQADEFIPAGFEVAKEEFAFATNNYFVSTDKSGSAALKQEDGTKRNQLFVRTGDVSYEFLTKGTSALVNIYDGEKPLLKEAPMLSFWRAPTDNDYGEKSHHKTLLWNAVTQTLTYNLEKKEEVDGKIKLYYQAKPAGVDVLIKVLYTIEGNGSLTTTVSYQANTKGLPEIPRFGSTMILAKDMDTFSWYGRGPHENYIDRKDDAFMGVWEGKVDEQAYPYYRPQETGNKMDVRWLTLKNKSGKGIKVDGAQPLSVSALPYRVDDMDPGLTKKQQHSSDLVARDETVLNIDLFQRGLGGITSWRTSPLDEYRFLGSEYQYTYTLSVIK